MISDLSRSVFMMVACLSVLVSGCSHFEVSQPKARKLNAEVQWVRPTFAGEYFKGHLYHQGAPVVTSSLIFQGNAIDGVAAFSTSNGTEKWRFKIKNGTAAPLTLHNDRLYFGGSDGQFYSLNSQNGQLLWSFPTRAETLAAATVVEGMAYFLTGNNTLYALNADNGKQAWAYARPETTSLTVRGGSQPVVDGHLVYVGFSDGYLVAINRKDGTLAWERQLNSNVRFRDVDATPVINDQHIFISSFDGALYCLSQKDGQIVWRVEEGGFAPVTVSGEKLFYSTSTQKVMALEKKSGKQIWSVPTHQGVATQPTILNDLVVFGESRGPLRFLTAQDGRELLEFSPGLGVGAKLVSLDSKTNLFMISQGANLYRLQVSWKRPEVLWPWEVQINRGLQ